MSQKLSNQSQTPSDNPTSNYNQTKRSSNATDVNRDSIVPSKDKNPDDFE